MATTNRTLEVTLPSDTEIRMTRVFDAPRELVFEAHSKPEHISQWWGRRQDTMPICELDFRPGGKWRFVNRGDDGEHAFRGEFREVVRPERITWTFEYEGMPGHISVETLTFTEHEGQTTLTSTSVFPSKEERDGMLETGMETGANETWDRLEEYVAAMRSSQ